MYKMNTDVTTHLQTVSINEAGRRLKALLIRIEEADEAVALERHGRSVAVIISWERYRGLLGEAATPPTIIDPRAVERMR